MPAMSNRIQPGTMMLLMADWTVFHQDKGACHQPPNGSLQIVKTLQMPRTLPKLVDDNALLISAGPQ